MRAAVGLMECLGLDGDRCIRMIPRQATSRWYASHWNAFLFQLLSVMLSVHKEGTCGHHLDLFKHVHLGTLIPVPPYTIQGPLALWLQPWLPRYVQTCSPWTSLYNSPPPSDDQICLLCGLYCRQAGIWH